MKGILQESTEEFVLLGEGYPWWVQCTGVSTPGGDDRVSEA